MIDYSKPIYPRSDGTFRLTYKGYDYHLVKDHPLYAEVAEFIAAHPDRARVEPTPPGPTPEEAIKFELIALDAKMPRYCEALFKACPQALKEVIDEEGTTRADIIAKKEALRAGIPDAAKKSKKG